MVNIVILVFVGGAVGAMLRELAMLMVPNLADNFPLDILVANLLAAFLLGLVTALHRRQVVSEGADMLLGAGMAVNIFELCLWGGRADVGLDGRRPRRISLCHDQPGAGLHRSYCRTEAQRTRLSMNCSLGSNGPDRSAVENGDPSRAPGGRASSGPDRSWRGLVWLFRRRFRPDLE